LMNEWDARDAGVTAGDTVLVESPHGRILRRVRVTSLLMPGVVMLGEGAWSDVVAGGIDRSGNANSLERSSLSGEGQCTWNSSVCRVVPWEGSPLPLDYRSADRRGAGIASVVAPRKRAARTANVARLQHAAQGMTIERGGEASPAQPEPQVERLVRDPIPSQAARNRQTFGNAAKLRISAQDAQRDADLFPEEGDAR